MLNTKLESVKGILSDNFKDANFNRNSSAKDLYGNSSSSRKLQDYIIESVLSNVSLGECLDWLSNLLIEFNIEQEGIDTTISYAESQFTVLMRFIETKSIEIKK